MVSKGARAVGSSFFHLHFDLLRLLRFRFRDLEFQDSVLVGGFHLLRLDLGGQGNRTGHLAFVALTSYIIRLLHLLLTFGCIADRQGITHGRDRNVLWLRSWYWSFNDVPLLILRFIDIDGERSAADDFLAPWSDNALHKQADHDMAKGWHRISRVFPHQ